MIIMPVSWFIKQKKDTMKKILKVTILALVVTVIGIAAHAQGTPTSIPDNGGPGVGGTGTTNTNTTGTGDGSVPFDGGLSLILLAAGAGVGLKNKKQQPTNY